ncbi:MAG: hypothetical protein ABEJ30_03645 [Halorientalis sp.]
MRNPLTYYGGIGWILVGLFLVTGVFAVNRLPAQVVLGLLGLGCLILGADSLRGSVTDFETE